MRQREWFVDLLAERTILTHLRDAKIVEGDVDAMLEARVGAIFMPHGLGHFLGLDVSDCCERMEQSMMFADP